MWLKASMYGVFWLLHFVLIFCFSSYVQAQNTTDPTEVNALLAIKASFFDPSMNLGKWNSKNRKDPCSTRWMGVHCYNRTLDDGHLHVRELELMKMNLSGTLAPELALLSRLKILNVMWNQIGGSIPKEIGNLTNLELLLLNGNQLTGSLPDELGYLPHLNRIQIDQNQISGSIPKSFANLNKTQHFHMNNNSISGEIPTELSRLPSLIHFLLDNNNLSGSLPAEFSELPNLLTLQLDNNNFSGSGIPASYGKMNKLLKLSLRNCSLKGSIPDLSGIANLSYIDLSFNQLIGPIPSKKLSDNITTIILSHNSLNGTIPQNFSSLHQLQKLSLDNNLLNGSIPSTLWESTRFATAPNLTLDFQNNTLTQISGRSSVPNNVTLLLGGNPVCSTNKIAELHCGSEPQVDNTKDMINHTNIQCPELACFFPYEYAPPTPTTSCYCAAPLVIYYRLKSPIFSDFRPYQLSFEEYITSGIDLNEDQLNISSTLWEEGPRLKMVLKLFPVYDNTTQEHLFNWSEVIRIWDRFADWEIAENETFGPYELLDFSSRSGISKGALAGIIVGTFAGALVFSAIIFLIILRKHSRKYNGRLPRRKCESCIHFWINTNITYDHIKKLFCIDLSAIYFSAASRIPIIAEGMKGFTYEELAHATRNFSSSVEVGKGGYGKVYKGVLNNGTLVAVKRAEEGSLQGNKEFCTEIELLSRLHHRHLVSLIGYCDKKGEQMLVYEFMPNGTLRDHLTASSERSLCFPARLRIALGSARGILYLHTEADPPIFHRDIKATNILLDSNFTAKVADFGLSRLAPLPDTDGVVPNHVSTVVRGTPGYLDPEYCLTHKLSDKSDVYSLGVVLLELLTGMKPISHGKNIVREVNTSYQSGNIINVVDERMGNYPPECIERFASLALKCCQDEAEGRPTMTEVVRELESIIEMIPVESDTRSSTENSSSRHLMGDRDSNPPSPHTRKNHFVSGDVSGSHLVSGTFPSISASNRALKAIKSSLIDPNNKMGTWDNRDPCNANWTGVFCFNTTFEDGYLHLRKLELLKTNLSGTLAPEVGLFSRLIILSFMWNNIGGSIPKQIGNLTNLELLLLNGNQLTSSLPDEIGNLPKLRRFQIDENKISGSIPKSFANLSKTKHFHMNNNSISGEIPLEITKLPSLMHLLLDNNNLSGSIPAELSRLPNLMILQLDNNNFNGTEIPGSFVNMTKLLKLSLRNCSLQGSVPDLSKIANLSYIDLSLNQLSGPIPTEKLSDNMTTIILSHNNLNETIPQSFSSLPRLQKLSLNDNLLSGSVPSSLWETTKFTTPANLTMDFRNNKLTEISGNSTLPANVTLLLEGNPICTNNSIGPLYCGSLSLDNNTQDITNHTSDCPSLACPRPYEYAPLALMQSCYCAAPLIIDFRLKSPGFSEFLPYQSRFEQYLTSELSLKLEQLNISSIVWQEGPRLKMDLKLFPVYDNETQNNLFKTSEVRRIWRMLTGWEVAERDTFGPYELLDFILLDPYKSVFPQSSSSSNLSKGALAGIILGTIAGVALMAIVLFFIAKKHWKSNKASKSSIIAELRKFSFEQTAMATSNFSSSAEIGKGGYGKVYKGVLSDGTLVAIKRRGEESLQGSKQFMAEINILSKLHHRYLVSLIGYCDDKGEQMLVYEFMQNGTLTEHISARSDHSLRFATRLRIALESARGILYLHTEAHNTIYHRDIKSSNILLDSKFTAKVADFGLSQLAPDPDTQGIVVESMTTNIKGTKGYLDPEYCTNLVYTDKSDVYSLGVVFLELLTGMQPIRFNRHIADEVSTLYKSGGILSAVDARMGSYPRECVEKFASLALRCCQEKGAPRPTMSEVVRELEVIIQMIPESDAKSVTISSSSNQESLPARRNDSFVTYDVPGSGLVSGIYLSIPPR
ncbi:hypothetical protein V2J09_007463 [Rumex salicifolius]